MATDYALNLKATLDTSEVQQKLQELGQSSTNINQQIDQSVQKLDNSIRQLNSSLSKVGQQQANFGATLKLLTRGAGAALIGHTMQSASNYAGASGYGGLATTLGYGSSVLKGAGAGAAVGSVIPGVGTAIGAAVGAAAGLASKALDNLAESAEKTAKVMEDIARLEGANARVFEQEAIRRQIEERVPYMSSRDLESRRQFLSQDVEEYHSFLMSNHERLGEAKKWGFNWTGGSWEIGPAGGKLSEYELQQAQLLMEQVQTLKEQADAAQKEIDAINKELESRGVGLDAREDLNEVIAEEARLIKEANDAATEKWNKEAASANAAVAAQMTEEERQKAEGQKQLDERKKNFERQEQFEQALQDQAKDLLSHIEGLKSTKAFEESLKTMTMPELVEAKKSLKNQYSELQTSAESKAAQARDLGGIEGARLLNEAQDELARSQEAESRLSQVEALLENANNFSLQDLVQGPAGSMQATGYSTLGNIGFDAFRETKQLQERTAQNTQKTADAVSQMKTDVMEIKTKLQNSSGSSVYT